MRLRLVPLTKADHGAFSTLAARAASMQLISCSTFPDSTSAAVLTDCIADKASPRRPLLSSQRGESGIKGTNRAMTVAGKGGVSYACSLLLVPVQSRGPVFINDAAPKTHEQGKRTECQ